MTDEVSVPRTRRALLAAAAGGAAALAASAALPLTAMAADPNDVVLGAPNLSTASTSITNSSPGSDAFAAAAAGTGFGLRGTSSGGAGVVGWSISAPSFDPADGAYTGVWGLAPTAPIEGQVGVGVVGESDDWGVLGLGTVGVYGYGTYGVIGESASTAAGVTALASSTSNLALEVVGKVKFSRSGRSNINAGSSSKLISVAGVTSSSKVFAVLHTNRSGRYVRAVVPASGRFRIYLNATVSRTTSVAWFVLD